LPVFTGIYQFFPLSRQKYFLPWQKANPEIYISYITRKVSTTTVEETPTADAPNQNSRHPHQKAHHLQQLASSRKVACDSQKDKEI
jgi:hypothetical protein